METRRRAAMVAMVIAAMMAGLLSCSSDDSEGAGTTEGTATGESAAPLTTATTPPVDIPLLGVVNGSGGTFEEDTLTLTGVQPSGIWFTDRPVRQAGTSAMEDFLALFFDRDDPPNAALDIAGADEDGDLAIVELTDPEWDDSANELTFTATIIADVEPERLASHVNLAGYLDSNDGAIPPTFDATALFIDSGASDEVTPADNEPTAAAVTQLESEFQSTVTALESVMTEVRIALAQDPGTCLTTTMSEAAEVLDNAYRVMQPKISTLKAEVAAGTSDIDGYDDAVSYQQSLELGLEQIQEEYTNYTRSGGC